MPLAGFDYSGSKASIYVYDYGVLEGMISVLIGTELPARARESPPYHAET